MPTYRQIFMVFLKMGAFAFGGVYSMLSFFQRELVEKRKWIDQEEFTEGVAVGQMTPGPPIINTGIFIGYRLRGFKGALAATLGQILPGVLLVLLLGYLYLRYKELALFNSVLKGLGAAVVGMLLSVIVKLARGVLKRKAGILIALACFCLLSFAKVNPIPLIALSGLAGYVFFRRPA